MTPKVVIFDIDNTLYSYTDGNRAAMEALRRYAEDELHVSADEFQRIWSEAYRVIGGRLKGRAACHNRLIRAQYVCRKLGLPDAPYARGIAKLYWDTLLDAAVPEPGLADLLTALRSAGILIAAGTNMTAFIQFEKIRVLGLEPFIDRIYTSEETDSEKPSAPFFGYCIDDLGVRPEDCIFIGDDAVNDYGASTAYGMTGIWYAARPGAHPAEETAVPEGRVIRSFTDCLDGGVIRLGDIEIHNAKTL